MVYFTTVRVHRNGKVYRPARCTYTRWNTVQKPGILWTVWMRSGVEIRQTWPVTNVHLNQQLARRLGCLMLGQWWCWWWDNHDDDSGGLNTDDIKIMTTRQWIKNHHFSRRPGERVRSAWIARQRQRHCGGEIPMGTPCATPVDCTKNYTMWVIIINIFIPLLLILIIKRQSNLFFCGRGVMKAHSDHALKILILVVYCRTYSA